MPRNFTECLKPEIWQKLADSLRLFLFATALVLVLLFYLPKASVPNTVTLRCDRLCPYPPNEIARTSTPEIDSDPTKSALLNHDPKWYTMLLLRFKKPFVELLTVCLSLIALLAHMAFLAGFFQAHTVVLHCDKIGRRFVFTLFDVLTFVSITSFLPFFICFPDFTWASFIAVLALIAFMLFRPYVGASRDMREPNSYWYFKTSSFFFFILTGVLLTYVSAELLSILVSRQKYNFVKTCLGEDMCSPEFYKAFCHHPSAYAQVKCKTGMEKWLPAIRSVPDSVTAIIAFFLGSTVLYTDIVGNRFVMGAALLIYYVVCLLVAFGRGNDVDFYDLNGGFFVGLLVGWLTTNCAFSQLKSKERFRDYSRPRTSTGSIYSGIRSLPPPYESLNPREDPRNPPRFPAIAPPPAFTDEIPPAVAPVDEATTISILDASEMTSSERESSVTSHESIATSQTEPPRLSLPIPVSPVEIHINKSMIVTNV